MATHLAEHPAILMIEVMLTQEEHTRAADVLVCVDPATYPMDIVSRRSVRPWSKQRALS